MPVLGVIHTKFSVFDRRFDVPFSSIIAFGADNAAATSTDVKVIYNDCGVFKMISSPPQSQEDSRHGFFSLRLPAEAQINRLMLFKCNEPATERLLANRRNADHHSKTSNHDQIKLLSPRCVNREPPVPYCVCRYPKARSAWLHH
jgi:hypothetical protein